MAAGRRLPPFDVLMGHVNEGLTNQAIAELYGTTAEAVRQALERGGYKRSDHRPNHGRFLPWRIRANHTGDVLLRRLRAYSKREQGLPLSPTEARLLDEWIKFMEGENTLGVPLSVHYDRMDDDGFWLEPRHAGDRDFIAPPAL